MGPLKDLLRTSDLTPDGLTYLLDEADRISRDAPAGGDTVPVINALAGMDITVATPTGYEPSPEVVATARAIAHGSKVVVTDDPVEAVAGARVAAFLHRLTAAWR